LYFCCQWRKKEAVAHFFLSSRLFFPPSSGSRSRRAKSRYICSGTLISDVSDHYFTFLLPSHAPVPKQTHRTVVTRDFSQANLLDFRGRLATADWTSVYAKSEVDAAYDEFWNIYSLVYNQTFQIKRQRFNRNIHKLQNFMTNGLLISRKTKKFTLQSIDL
jgi:hypothetical protein